MDRISEFLTRIRNAGLAGQEKVDVPSSNERVGIATVLEETGFIKSFKVAKDGKQGMMRADPVKGFMLVWIKFLSFARDWDLLF